MRLVKQRMQKSFALGKAVEALTPTVTVNSVITEGNTQVQE